MEETVLCPFCDAKLTLPTSADGQTAQCPRCRRDFEPGRKRAAAASSSSSKPAETRREPRGAQPLGGEWKATLLLALLAGCILALASQLLVNSMRLSLINEQNDLDMQDFIGPGPRLPLDFLERWDYWEQIARNMITFDLLLLAVTMIAFLVWLHHTSANLRLLQADGLTHTPAGAVFSFFLPFVNIYRPCAIMQEIGQASDPRSVRNARAWKTALPMHQVTIWWLSFMAAAGLALFALWTTVGSRHDPDAEQFVMLFWCGSNLAMIVAAVMLMIVIHLLEQRQQERYARLWEDDPDA